MNLAVLAFATGLAAADPVTYPGRQGGLRVAVPRLEETIQVDGALDDAAWGRAAHLLEFSQYSPVDGRPANEATEVLVFYSPAAIHFGVRAHATPGSVRATLANRDRIDAEDSVTFLLSTFNDGRQAVMFSVNPLGVQADGTVVEQTRGRGEGFGSLSSERETADLSPDFVFDSKGRLTDAGYEVEVRIPFESLRYQKAEVQAWGLHVLRRSQSTGHEDSWAPAKRAASSFLSQAGTLEGLRELRPGLVLDLNPVLTAKADGGRSPSGWDYETGAPEPGGNVRWGVTPNLTLNGTVNPDFSQVEADAGQFVFDPRQAVFFPEKRPFFLDGLEQFTTPNRLIYTRRIAAPVGAVKLTGKAAGTNLGLLAAVDDRASSSAGDDHPLFAVARIQKDLGGQSRAGLVFTDRAENGGRNTVGGLDTRIVFGGVYDLALQGALSRTRPGGGAADTAPLWEGVFARNGRRFGFRHQITGIHEDFRAQSGFIGRPGIVRANLDHRVSFFGAKGALLEAFHTDLVLDGIWRYRDFVGPGGIQDKKLHLNNNATLRGGWKAGASVLVESFGYDPDLYEGYALEGDTPGEILPFVGVPRLPNLDWVLTVNTPEWKRFSGYAFVLWGRDENFFEWASADIVYATLRADWRPTEQLRFNVEYQLQQFERRTDHSLVGRRQIPRLKVEYQLTRAIFLRFVGEYDAQRQDDLRDASRTERPILIRNADGVHERALASRDNRFRVDVLFSYQPTPGTVFFAGYGSTLDEPEELRFRNLTRRRDGFFVKISYLFRL